MPPQSKQGPFRVCENTGESAPGAFLTDGKPTGYRHALGPATISSHTLTYRGRLPGSRWVWVLAGGVALLLSACSDSSPPTQTAPARPPQPPPAAKAAAPPAETKAPTPEAPPYVYEVKGRRDPFRPLVAPRVAEVKKPRRPTTELGGLEVTELKLVGIVWERRGYFALVEGPNGKGYVLRLNDTVGEDARVTKITPQGVTFEVKDAPAVQQAQARAMELRLRKEE